MNITELFEVWILRALGFDNNEVVGGYDSGSNKKLFKSKKSLVLEHAFIFWKLTFTDIQIEKNDFLRCLLYKTYNAELLALHKLLKFRGFFYKLHIESRIFQAGFFCYTPKLRQAPQKFSFAWYIITQGIF